MGEVVGTFGGAEVIKDVADGVPEQVDASGCGASEQGLELGEGQLDRVQIRRVRRQIEEAGALGLDGVADAIDLVGLEVIHHHEVAGSEGRRQHLGDVGQEAHAVDRAVEDARCGEAVVAQRGDKVVVFQGPCGTAATSRVPRRARPYRLAMVVVAQVSSMNTSRSGLNAGCWKRQAARAVATSGRCCSAACWVFFFASAPQR